MPKAKIASDAMKKQDLTKKVMEQIHEGRAKMHPRIHFIIGSTLLGTGLVGAIVLATLFINFAFFRLQTHAPFGYLWFGRFGLRPFFAIFPWLPLFVATAGFVGAIILLRHFDISYKWGLAGLVVGLLALVLTTGLLLSPLGFNEQARRFGPLRPFYPDRFAGEDWVVGEVLKVEDEKMTITTPEGDKVAVLWSEETLLPFGADFKVGEKVRVVGQRQDENTFVAKGIGRDGMHWQMMDDRVRRDREPRHLPW